MYSIFGLKVPDDGTVTFHREIELKVGFGLVYCCYCEVGATERGCSGSIGSDDTRGYGAGSGDVGKELPRGMIP